MTNLIIFSLLSIPVFFLSRHTLLIPGSHGFYRFFSWECICWLLAFNYIWWFNDPFSLIQIISWVFLFVSLFLVLSGIIQLKKKGKPDESRKEKSLYTFEKTTHLVTSGIFNYIRHPLYSSLIFLTWGIFLKKPEFHLLIAAFLSSACLYLTARSDEKECLEYFGKDYEVYMKRSKMFIPFLI
jgi:protein-S-isoprenylcysteine O-methyltransferase Ste14